MNNIMNYVENPDTSEFYPTPKDLVDKMLAGIDWKKIKTILEPSAGKGDILREIARHEDVYVNHAFDVDCIEKDSYIRQILNYNFSEREKNLNHRKSELTSNRYSKEMKITPEEEAELKYIKDEEETFFFEGIHIVHDDFLTYHSCKQYDLIVMNPPFSEGEKHLLKALDMQKRGGNIICLLNAQTIKNPYSQLRKKLVELLDKYSAEIEYIDNAFETAERITGVEIALIRVYIPTVQEESDIYNRLKKAEKLEDYDTNVTDLDVTDFIKNIISHYKVECQAGIDLIRQYKALVPYIMSNFNRNENVYSCPLLELKLGTHSVSENGYIKRVRSKYWHELLSNPKFIGRLTKKLQDEYMNNVQILEEYEFSEFNIYTLVAEINSQIRQGIEDEIIVMFDKLTQEHSWYPECAKTIHYYDGWATNKAHKIGNKIILPYADVFSGWNNKPVLYRARGYLEDIERILNFLDGNMTLPVDTWKNIDISFNNNITKNIECKYFKATFYKKGTIHLTFTCPELIERFNIYVAMNKNWLPPCYGKKKYSDMTDEERTVIDNFQGEESYNTVIKKSDYYLRPLSTGQMLTLGDKN